MTHPSDDDDDYDGSPLTEAELQAARERWSKSEQIPDGAAIFSRPVYGPGLRGDVAIGYDDDDEDEDEGDG